jgi:DnaJ-class molecular chaperone
MGRDLYAILGVPRGADAETLKKAYRRLALRWHPDKNPDNPAEAQSRFQEISEAYAVLGDAARRARYDRDGEDAPAPPAPPARDLFRTFFVPPFSAFFADGAFGPRPAAAPFVGALTATLEQLFAGFSTELRHLRTVNGRPEEVILPLAVAPGTLAGTRFTFAGEGDRRPGCAPQDVVVVVAESAHARFTREREHLRAVLRVSLKESLCGVVRTREGIDGRALEVTTRRVVRPGAELALRGEGMPRTGGRVGRGDLIVAFDVVYPDELEDGVREALAAALPD